MNWREVNLETKNQELCPEVQGRGGGNMEEMMAEKMERELEELRISLVTVGFWE